MISTITRQDCIFASAHSIQVASCSASHSVVKSHSLPQHTLYRLHRTIIGNYKAQSTLPQHTLYRLHRPKYTVQLLTNCKMCCESVDSFSADHKRFTALTIFPCSFATKATYVAISGSIGRTIDRFCRCELCYNILIAMGSRNTHT